MDLLEPRLKVWYVPPPGGGEWGYEVDDYDVEYAPASWPVLFRRRGGISQENRLRTEYSMVIQLAPDVSFCAWGSHYVLAAERYTPIMYDGQDPYRLAFTVTLARRVSVDAERVVTVQVSVPGGDFRRCEVLVPDDSVLPGDLVRQLNDKLRRLEAWYHKARREQAEGHALVTAHERWIVRGKR